MSEFVGEERERQRGKNRTELYRIGVNVSDNKCTGRNEQQAL